MIKFQVKDVEPLVNKNSLTVSGIKSSKVMFLDINHLDEFGGNTNTLGIAINSYPNTWEYDIVLAEGANTITLTAIDSLSNPMSVKTFVVTCDTSFPIIELLTAVPENTYLKSIPEGANVSGDVKYIKIIYEGGEPEHLIELDESGIIPNTNNTLFKEWLNDNEFNLANCSNFFDITAIDWAGNESEPVHVETNLLPQMTLVDPSYDYKIFGCPFKSIGGMPSPLCNERGDILEIDTDNTNAVCEFYVMGLNTDPETSYSDWTYLDSINIDEGYRTFIFPSGYIPDGMYRVKAVGKFKEGCEDNATEEKTIISDQFLMDISNADISINPFNPDWQNTFITYHLSEGGTVTISIYNDDKTNLFRIVEEDTFKYGDTIKYKVESTRAIVPGPGPEPGNLTEIEKEYTNSTIWDGRDSGGQILPNGAYKILIRAEDFAGNIDEEW